MRRRRTPVPSAALWAAGLGLLLLVFHAAEAQAQYQVASGAPSSLAYGDRPGLFADNDFLGRSSADVGERRGGARRRRAPRGETGGRERRRGPRGTLAARRKPPPGIYGVYPRWCGSQPAAMLPWGTESDAGKLWSEESREARASQPTPAVAPVARVAARDDAFSDDDESAVGNNTHANRRLLAPMSPSTRIALRKCLLRPEACGANVRSAAKALPGVKKLVGFKPTSLGPVVPGKQTCAIVGNSGHLVKGHDYGPYVDAHDVVVRFNIMQTVGPFYSKVGMKTTARLLNKARARAVCSRTDRLPEWKDDRRALLKVLVCWHRDNRRAMAACLKRKLNLPTVAFTHSYDQTLKRLFGVLKGDLGKLGYYGFGTRGRTELTSGMQALLTMVRLCGHVDVYGMTSWSKSKRGPDQYGGRARKRVTGLRVHDWRAESFVTRLLHAAGVITICSA